MKPIKIPSEQVDLNPDAYNSNFHTSLEAPSLTIPSETPQSFIRWLPLIARSQSIPESSIQHITLTPAQTALILAASSASLHTGVKNRMYAEELRDLEDVFEGLRFGNGGLFCRLDECSPKDGVKGTSPLLTPAQIIIRLTTSHRATNAMIRQLEKMKDKEKEEEGDGDGSAFGGVELVFLPYNQKMNTSKEFRVFCKPRGEDYGCVAV